MQNFCGLYQSTFIVQTLGEHYSAIDGFQNISGVHDQEAKPRGALALLIAAVCNHISTRIFLITLVGWARIDTLGHSHGHYRNGPHSKEQKYFVAQETEPFYGQSIQSPDWLQRFQLGDIHLCLCPKYQHLPLLWKLWQSHPSCRGICKEEPTCRGQDWSLHQYLWSYRARQACSAQG